MGAQFKVNGKYVFNIESWSVEEDTTPLAAGDTYGSTGSLRVTIPSPDPYVPHTQDTGTKWVLDFGRDILLDKPFTFADPVLGMIAGRITSISASQFGMFDVQCETSLNKLNIYNVQAQPFTGTLGNLLRYYCGLASTPTPVIDPALNTRPITAIGWSGELWYHLKMLAIAEEFEIALVNGVPTFRMLRQRDVVRGRDIGRGGALTIPPLAQTVEAYQYNTVAISDQLVYPPGGWSRDVQVLNVNAGGDEEYTLELSASVSSIQAPVAVNSVDPSYAASSVYTVIGSDGLVVPADLWTARGGRLEVKINEDTTSLTVKIHGATNIPTVQGTASTNFQIALSDDNTRYSTLRIVGSGVAFDKVKRTFRTGVPASRTGTLVGETTDNPFLSTTEQCYRAGIRSAVRFSGPIPGASAEVTKAVSGLQFGRVAGSRMFSNDTKRYYRLRDASISQEKIQANFEDDLLYQDVEGFHDGQTYAQVQASRAGTSYRDDYLMGLR